MRKILTLGAVFLSVQATTCLAQSSSLEQEFSQGSEARATLTLPFGTQTRSYKDKARFEFGIRQYQSKSKHDWVFKSGAADNFDIYNRQYVDSNFGFTLSNDTAFLVNGQALQIETQELGINDTTKVAIGVVGVIVVGAFIAGVVTAADVNND